MTMKKIFTLLFCVAAMAFAANAQDDDAVQKCINIVLGNEQPTTTIKAANYDVNQDGVIDIEDVTLLIQANLEAKVQKAPAQEEIDIDNLVKEVLESKTGEPNISDVNRAIDQNLKRKK